MEKNEFMDKMEKLNVPAVTSEIHKKQLKLTLLNTRKSAAFGVLLIVTPFLFLMGILLKYYLNWHSSIFTVFYEWLVNLDPDSDTSILSWLIRFLLLGGPALAVVLNLLALVHFQYDKQGKELLISIKIKWLNLAIVAVCTFFLLIFLFYLLLENVNHG